MSGTVLRRSGPVGAGRAAAYIFFVPLVSLVVGAVPLGETLDLSLLPRAALVVIGCSWSTAGHTGGLSRGQPFAANTWMATSPLQVADSLIAQRPR